MVRMERAYEQYIARLDLERARQHIQAWRTSDVVDPCAVLPPTGWERGAYVCTLPVLHPGPHRDQWGGVQWSAVE